jgi:hypothetical protein
MAAVPEDIHLNFITVVAVEFLETMQDIILNQPMLKEVVLEATNPQGQASTVEVVVAVQDNNSSTIISHNLNTITISEKA